MTYLGTFYVVATNAERGINTYLAAPKRHIPTAVLAYIARRWGSATYTGGMDPTLAHFRADLASPTL